MELRFGNASEVGMSQQQLDKVKRIASDWVDENFTPALTYLVARKGLIVAHGAAGKLEPKEDSVPLPKDALFPLASITKLFTATAIMMLTEDGKLSPVTRVCEIIPEFIGEGCGDNKKDIFINHLMTHTSGLKDDAVYEYSESMKEKIEIPPCEETESESVHNRLYYSFGAPLTYKIGTYMSYSSYSYEFLGEIIRRVSKQSLGEFFKERIFEPLGMKDTYLEVPECVWDQAVKPREDSVMSWMSSPSHLKSASASGGAYSTVYDMAVFGQMFLNGGIYNGKRILSRLSVQAMTQNQTENIPSGWGSIRFPQAGWGLGFMISLFKKDDTGTLRSPKTFSHTGYGCTYLAMDPENEVVLVCFQVSTKQNSEDNELHRRFDIFSDVALAAIE